MSQISKGFIFLMVLAGFSVQANECVPFATVKAEVIEVRPLGLQYCTAHLNLGYAQYQDDPNCNLDREELSVDGQGIRFDRVNGHDCPVAVGTFLNMSIEKRNGVIVPR